MNLKDVIRLDKTVKDYGRWSNGHIDRASWPLKRKKLKFSNDWHWRVIFLETDEREFRVLLRLNPILEQFYAYLGEIREDTIAILCSHDLHTSHANWHCHVGLGNISDVLPGVWRDRNTFRYWPSYTGECTEVFDVTKESAMKIASGLYRFPSPAQGELFA